MQTDKRQLILDALNGDSYKKRLKKVREFELLGGGGIFKKIERVFVSPMIYIPYVFYAKLGMHRWLPARIKLFWGRAVRIPMQDYDALMLSMYGGLSGSELKLTKFFIKNLKSDDVFYDVGANFGFYTYLATELCKETHVFEPMPGLANIVSGNMRQTDVAVVNATALSDINGVIDFYVTNSTMVSTINPSVVKTYASHATNSTFRKITVPTVTIDEYVKENEKPTAMKIDAEGAEDQIIQGGTNFFSSNSPIIAMEIWGNENGGGLSMSAAERLRAMGYRSYRLDNDGNIQEASGRLSDEIRRNGADNFIFKK